MSASKKNVYSKSTRTHHPQPQNPPTHHPDDPDPSQSSRDPLVAERFESSIWRFEPFGPSLAEQRVDRREVGDGGEKVLSCGSFLLSRARRGGRGRDGLRLVWTSWRGVEDSWERERREEVEEEEERWEEESEEERVSEM